MLLAYCIRRRSDPPPDPALIGVAGAPVERLEEGDLALWFSRGVPRRVSERALREHDRVVRAALATATPLPTRFGTRFADEKAASASLRDRQAEFLASLARVEGCVEMGLRLGWPAGLEPVPVPAPGRAAPVASGRDYLERRRAELRADDERRQSAEALADAVEAELAGLDLPTARTLLPSEDSPAILAHLVHRGQMDSYLEGVERARTALRPVTLTFSGPWAPYSFA